MISLGVPLFERWHLPPSNTPPSTTESVHESPRRHRRKCKENHGHGHEFKFKGMHSSQQRHVDIIPLAILEHATK
eukprot:scaffold2365_cov77-Skeletonema_dohrnii-CCMP3373.AAC.37